MSIDPKYEIKVKLYDGNESDTIKFIEDFENLRKTYREEGSVMSRVISYFFEGMVKLLYGDQGFWKNDYLKSYQNYVEADKMFNRFKNSRNVQVRLDYLADRMIKRVEGMMKLSEGLRHNDPKLKETAFQEALKYFNDEVSLANKLEENMSSYAAFSRAAFAESQFLLTSSLRIKEENSGNAKKDLMKARDTIRQATFIDKRFQPFYYEIEDTLDDLTKNRIILKAENFGDEATFLSEDGKYLDAKEGFRKASLFYKRASALASDTSTRRFLLSSATIYEASELEADGNHLFRRENKTSLASRKFEEAAKHVDKAIALMGRFGSKPLELTFTSQRDFYRAMGIQASAINLFDEELYNESKDTFNESLNLFTSTVETAKEAENEVLVSLGEEAIADIKGYLSMCDAML